MKELWYEKYRPKTIDQYIFTDENQKNAINKYIQDGSIPHLMLYGHRGTGKTSLAYLFKNIFDIDDSDFYESNASHDNSVDNIRTKVSGFATTMATGAFKLIFLDEADRLTPAAQDSLKKIMEQYAHNVRFIFACNKVGKIIPEIRSRCQELYFQNLDKMDMMEKAAKILVAENIKITFETLEKYVDIAYPDFRKLLNLLEKNSVGGVLNAEVEKIDNLADIKFEAMMYVETGNWAEARTLLAEQLTDDDYEDLFSYFYEHLDKLDKFRDMKKWKAGVVIIAEYLYRNQFVADKEINFCAMMIRLSEI